MRFFACSALVAAALLALGVAPANAADTVHTGTYWTWTGPEAWTSNENFTGLTIYGDKGAVVDRSQTDSACASGSTQAARAEKWLKSQRQALKADGAKLTGVGAITAANGVRKQKVDFTFEGTGSKPYKGFVVFAYRYLDSEGGVLYCRGTGDMRYSVAKHWAAKAPQLAKISKSVVRSVS